MEEAVAVDDRLGWWDELGVDDLEPNQLLGVEEVDVVLDTGCEGSLEELAVEEEPANKTEGGAGDSLSDPLSQASSFSQDECDWESEKESAASEEAGGRRRDLLDVLITSKEIDERESMSAGGSAFAPSGINKES
jgi:hypothetical protein